MSRASLQEALRDALAAALAADREDVEIAVTAPGWEDARDREATVTIELAALAAGEGNETEGAVDTEESDDFHDQDVSSTPGTTAVDDADDQPQAADDVEQTADESGEDEGGSADADGAPGFDDEEFAEDEGPTPEQLDEEAEAAADFMEALLDAFDLPGDLKIRVGDDHAEVEVVEVDGGALIGRRGQTLDAIQELVRCSLQRQFQRRTRVRVDVEGYRARRLEKLEEKTLEAIEEVLDSGKSVRLEPMDVFERKAVHGIVANHDGVTSHSQGREPGRRVIIEPA